MSDIQLLGYVNIMSLPLKEKAEDREITRSSGIWPAGSAVPRKYRRKSIPVQGRNSYSQMAKPQWTGRLGLLQYVSACLLCSFFNQLCITYRVQHKLVESKVSQGQCQYDQIDSIQFFAGDLGN